MIKQLSIFVENKAGRLAEITAELAKAGVDIRALSVADTTNFGILRLIVDKPDEAERILRASPTSRAGSPPRCGRLPMPRSTSNTCTLLFPGTRDAPASSCGWKTMPPL